MLAPSAPLPEAIIHCLRKLSWPLPISLEGLATDADAQFVLKQLGTVLEDRCLDAPQAKLRAMCCLLLCSAFFFGSRGANVSRSSRSSMIQLIRCFKQDRDLNASDPLVKSMLLSAEILLSTDFTEKVHMNFMKEALEALRGLMSQANFEKSGMAYTL
uniref:Uncharacterized protein n=1 Tax=Mycena chlorophos TaxID=658473 RepID=A0ABQ0MFR6_MYCCL|nr:predicted protein [Mycena chlorophos]